MKSIAAGVFALALLASGTAGAQIGAGVQVGPIGGGAQIGNGVSAGAHVGSVGAGVGVGVGVHHRVCHGGWYWHDHHHYCRRW